MLHKKNYVTLLVLMLCLIVSCEKKLETIKVTIKGTNFVIECARTKAEQQKGLMYRKKLDSRKGMIFIYSQYTKGAFWMKNTYIPLSIAFLSKEGEILDIKDMKPLSLNRVISQHPYMYALEVNQGVFKEINAGIGDFVVFPKGFH